MKPNFALVLSFDDIRLLQRAPGGWLDAGAVGLDAPDLATALADLRADATRLDPEGMRAKLVIPNEQIRYLTIDTAGLSDEATGARVLAALDGATPYPVNELAHDWVRDGDKTHIAAVAFETLDEAEAFAIEHEFHPVSFAAIPPAGSFSGEPFFGAAPSSAEWLAPTDSLSRDMQPIRVVGTADWPSPTEPELHLSNEDVENDAPVTSQSATEAPRPDDAPDNTPEVVSDDLPQDDQPAPKRGIVAKDAPDIAAHGTEPESGQRSAGPSAPLAVAADIPDMPAFASIRAARDVPPPAPRINATAPVIDIEEDDLPEAPPLVGDGPDTDRPVTAPVLTAEKREPSTASADLGRVFSRGDSNNLDNARQPDRATPSVATAPIPPAMAAAAQSVMPDPSIDAEDERRRMTIFGARKPAPEPKTRVGGKPRYLGLMLTAVLLLFLAGVAAWASIFSETGALSRLWSQPVTDLAALPEDAVEDPAVQTDPAEIEGSEADAQILDEPVDLTALDPAFLPDETVADLPELLSVPTPIQDLTPEQAAVRYAATGIWQMAPQQPDMPGYTQLDDLYTASIDPDVNIGDAVALPALRDMLSDRMIEQQSSPAAAGTDFNMDDRGLVRATPEGALTPDGVRVIAGRPPVLPASLPTRFEETPRLADAEQARLSEFRPRARPGDLVQQNERSNLGGLTRNELATFRPRPRPDSVQQIAQEIAQAEDAAQEDITDETSVENATAQAVALSVKPRPRPGNFGQIVQRAERTPPPDPVQTAAVAPRTVAPSVPSSASVAREATVRNAIRLNQVNLIGVYGKPSDRSALIRMSNGRYVKVKVGDRLDGGRVQAIGESELQYTKGGRPVTLTMPRG